MAILRGGKRIGGMDIRIGIPRDRSLDNVTGDPRLNLPNCQCTQPPSRGFCRYGMCIWGSLNISKGSGSLTITIPF